MGTNNWWEPSLAKLGLLGQSSRQDLGGLPSPRAEPDSPSCLLTVLNLIPTQVCEWTVDRKVGVPGKGPLLSEPWVLLPALLNFSPMLASLYTCLLCHSLSLYKECTKVMLHVIADSAIFMFSKLQTDRQTDTPPPHPIGKNFVAQRSAAWPFGWQGQCSDAAFCLQLHCSCCLLATSLCKGLSRRIMLCYVHAHALCEWLRVCLCV